MFFFFKQKTAYEMRISDWSSDVCSSDLVTLLCEFPYLRIPIGHQFLPFGGNLVGLLQRRAAFRGKAGLGVTLLCDFPYLRIPIGHQLLPFGDNLIGLLQRCTAFRGKAGLGVTHLNELLLMRLMTLDRMSNRLNYSH